MERSVCAASRPFLCVCLLLAGGCASSSTTRIASIAAFDNVGGAAHASVVQDAKGEALIEAPTRVGDCGLRDFLVGTDDHAQTPGTTHVVQPQQLEADRALLRLEPSAPTTVTAQYVHTVLVDSGSRTEPDSETHTTGSGEVQVGRVLSNGYRFDHYEFKSVASGPGGAFARVVEPPHPQTDQSYMRIAWFYDPNSQVSFSWKIYATGRCDATP